MSHPIRFEEVQKQPPPRWSKRVQILEKDYQDKSRELSKSAGRAISVKYNYETRDFLEKIFDEYSRMKPESLKCNINAVYRVKDKLGKEWYYYHGNKTCENKFNQPVSPYFFENEGWHKSPKIGLTWNETRGQHDPAVVGYTGAYENPWNPQEVKALLDSSFIPCNSFYVGKASENGRDAIEERYYSIQNREDFIEASWSDLYDMGRLGISYETPSRQLVSAALAKEKRDREEKVGLKEETSAYK